jgi:hypothetical protein
MKSLLAGLLFSVAIVAAASADLVIESQIESPQINTASTIKVKGDKLRIDMANGPLGAMSTIMDTKSGDAIQLIHSQKMAMKTSGAMLKQAMDAAKGKAAGAGSPELKATGQTEKVAGYDCDIYTWSDGANSGKIWVAKNHPQAAALKSLEKQMRSGILGGAQSGPDTSKLAGAAIKQEMTNQGVKISSSILSVTEQDIDAKEFDVPAGYNAMALPGAPGGN